ncbi:MAG: putative LPS assembly protein LptD, partial [Longimicrobiales bacterium]
TLFPALPGEGGPFSNVTWSASARANRALATIDETLAGETQQNMNEFDGSVSSSFSFGRFSWSQGFSVRQEVAEARTVETDTVVDLARKEDRTGNWSSSFSYQQPLIATTSLTPNLSLSGDFARDTLDGAMVQGPTRMNFGASLNTDFFGFFPGFGPFEAIRHHISPSFSYSYSPRPSVDERQARVFGVTEVSERNTLSIQFNQTFEAKFKEGRGPGLQRPELPLTKADSLALLPEAERLMLPDSLRAMADSAIAANPALLEPPDTSTSTSGPRRRETAQKMTLLAINTNALVYDFVRAREDGEGFRTTTLSNTLRSDLLPGFDLRVTHDLFERPEPNALGSGIGIVLPGGEPERRLAPHLSQMAFGFNLNSDSWISRIFRGGGDDEEAADSMPPVPEAAPGAELPMDPRGGGQELIGGPQREAEQPPTTPVGTWNASINYSLNRPRDGLERQMVTGSLRFQPTVNWSVSWNTGYSITEGQFTDHALTLSRRLHDFDASFDFYKAQNGNFTFQFRVHLRANPDLKFDYDQRDLPALDPRAR